MRNSLTHIQGRKFLATAKEPAKGSHIAVSSLRSTVEEGKKRLATLLEKKALAVYIRCGSTDWMTPTNSISSTRRDYELKGALTKFIVDAHEDQTEMDERGSEQPPTTTRTVSAVYQSAKSKITSSRELLGHYKRASQQVAFGQRAPMMMSGWEKDSQTLRRILHEQGEKIKHEIHKSLIGDPKFSREEVKGKMSELDTDLWNQFAVGRAEEENVESLAGRKGETWAAVAKNAQRGVRHVVKNLPEDGE